MGWRCCWRDVRHPSGGCLSPGPGSSLARLCPARGGPGICFGPHVSRSDARWAGHSGVPLLGQRHLPPRICGFLPSPSRSVRSHFCVLLVFCPAQEFARLSVSLCSVHLCVPPTPRPVQTTLLLCCEKPLPSLRSHAPLRALPLAQSPCFGDVESVGLGSGPCTCQGKPSLVPPHVNSLQGPVSPCPRGRPGPTAPAVLFPKPGPCANILLFPHRPCVRPLSVPTV